VIRVVDQWLWNRGRSTEEAFRRARDSKLSCDDDLLRFRRWEFRGEALASIGAVSQGEDFERVPRARPATKSRITAGPLAMFRPRPGMWERMAEGAEFILQHTRRRKFSREGKRSGHVSRNGDAAGASASGGGISFSPVAGKVESTGLRADERLLAAWPTIFASKRCRRLRDAEICISESSVARTEIHRQISFIYLNGPRTFAIGSSNAIKGSLSRLDGARSPTGGNPDDRMPPGDVDVNVHPTRPR